MRLPANLDLSAAGPLRSALCEARGLPLEIDASGVERVGAQCLQVLIAAQRRWRADQGAFSIVGSSAAFVEALSLANAEDLLAELAV